MLKGPRQTDKKKLRKNGGFPAILATSTSGLKQLIGLKQYGCHTGHFLFRGSVWSPLLRWCGDWRGLHQLFQQQLT